MGFWGDLFKSKKRNNPEDYYKTEITESYVRVTHPHRNTEEINWSEIEEIKLANTDDGPLAIDIWLVLIGNNKGCSIPHGSEGYEDVYDIISTYEGFNFENVIKSMSCTDNQLFELWKK
ncbi:hypothetical protein DCS32_01945 [Dokdonia sp. Dokd-P16]|uniref:hypothetical protein n=1 Tax=Dokdonia sp. Dokd-P16 TaxID=2173169 RepID=UPI000D54ACF7|nr:hypothetical protein [Dokdonia sp. Dokd-P16]AWH72968.1 hypothetical protein DCS32_01945 [Dokdonia sp. Dokd-P16]